MQFLVLSRENPNKAKITIVRCKALAIVLRTIAIAIAIEVKKSIEYCNNAINAIMQYLLKCQIT